MAAGDITFFEEALDYAFFGGWATTDVVKLAILDNTTAPTAADTTPALADYTEVGTAGNYVAGGWTITENYGALSVEAAGTLTFDSNDSPTWAQNASNDVDAYWGLMYNDTQAGDPAFLFIDLGGPVDMSAGSLTITFSGSGIFTIS